MGGYVVAIVFSLTSLWACEAPTCTGTFNKEVSKGYTSTVNSEQKGSIDASVSFGIASDLFTDLGVKSSASASFTNSVSEVTTESDKTTINQTYTNSPAYFYQTNMTFQFSDNSSVTSKGGCFMADKPQTLSVTTKIPILSYHVSG